RPDGDGRADGADLAELAANPGQADDLVRLGDVLLLPVEEVCAAGQEFGLAPLLVEQRQRLLDRGRLVIGEVLHWTFPPFAMASRTRLGVSGRNGTRTPRA